MEEVYNKIVNGEININHLSPTDLVELAKYLEDKNISLQELIEEEKKTNRELDKRLEELSNIELEEII